MYSLCLFIMFQCQLNFLILTYEVGIMYVYSSQRCENVKTERERENKYHINK